MDPSQVSAFETMTRWIMSCSCLLPHLHAKSFMQIASLLQMAISHGLVVNCYCFYKRWMNMRLLYERLTHFSGFLKGESWTYLMRNVVSQSQVTTHSTKSCAPALSIICPFPRQGVTQTPLPYGIMLGMSRTMGMASWRKTRIHFPRIY